MPVRTGKDPSGRMIAATAQVHTYSTTPGPSQGQGSALDHGFAPDSRSAIRASRKVNDLHPFVQIVPGFIWCTQGTRMVQDESCKPQGPIGSRSSNILTSGQAGQGGRAGKNGIAPEGASTSIHQLDRLHQIRSRSSFLGRDNNHGTPGYKSRTRVSAPPEETM